jgi:hypothetical protein
LDKKITLAPVSAEDGRLITKRPSVQNPTVKTIFHAQIIRIKARIKINSSYVLALLTKEIVVISEQP